MKTRFVQESFESMTERSVARARKLDAGEPIEPENIISFEDPLDLLELLSVERIRLLKAARGHALPVDELARRLGRPRPSVMRDIKRLEALGVLERRKEPNPGHGQRTLVQTVGERFELTASF